MRYGCVRAHGKKDPISVEIIKDLVEKYCTKNATLLDLRFITVCLTGFAGFLRIDELLRTQLKHVTILEDHMQIFLLHAKTDQHREGNKVIIAKTNTKFCPVEHVKLFLKKANLDIHQNSEAFLIPQLHKTKNAHTASKTTGVSYTTIRDNIRKNLETVKKDGDNFGLHCLQSGGASSAAHLGVSDRLISTQGSRIARATGTYKMTNRLA